MTDVLLAGPPAPVWSANHARRYAATTASTDQQIATRNSFENTLGIHARGRPLG